MKFELISVGKIRDRHYRALTDDYLSRLERYLPVEEIEVSGSRQAGGDVKKGLAEEAEAFKKAASDTAVTIALDERGKHVTSRQLAGWVDDWMVSGRRYVSLFIGSAHGLDESFRKGCDRRLALSKMTLPHEMARMLLAEQLYRAMTILRGEPYHK